MLCWLVTQVRHFYHLQKNLCSFLCIRSLTKRISFLEKGMAFLMFLSYYWTHQVLSNTMHVTSAGVIGTWWFAPQDASAYCSPAIGDSFRRASTYSFGSICFGSLIVAVIQALRQLNHYLRGNEDAQILVCIIDCILGCIEGIIEYFNKWAYVYVGLYGTLKRLYLYFLCLLKFHSHLVRNHRSVISCWL